MVHSKKIFKKLFFIYYSGLLGFPGASGSKESACNAENLGLTPRSSWNSPGKNTGVGSHSLLPGIFLTRDGTQILYRVSYQGRYLSI